MHFVEVSKDIKFLRNIRYKNCYSIVWVIMDLLTEKMLLSMYKVAPTSQFEFAKYLLSEFYIPGFLSIPRIQP